MTEVTLLARAQKLAARGIPVLPAEPGTKKPRPLRWQTTATTDPEQINEWWQRWPDSWVGVPMGLRTGLLVVDLDDKNGKTGSANFAALVGERELPDCPIRQTPSGGVHLYFRHVPGARNSVSALADGVDVRAEGGQVISYSDDFPSDAPECPNWLKELILARSSGVSLMPAAEDPYDGQRRPLTREDLSRAAGARDTPAKRLCGEIYDGVAWGVAGGRSNALTTLRTYLLSTYPDLDPEGTAELFAESCAAVRAAEEGVPRAEETTVEWIAQMLRGGIGYATALRVHEEKLAAEAHRAFPGLEAALERPEIVTGPDVHRVVAEAISALAADSGLYQREARLVRTIRVAEPGIGEVVGQPRIAELDAAALLPRMTATARWMRHDGRKQGGALTPAKPTADVVSAVLGAGEWPGVRALVGVIETPTLREDGTVISEPGYDPASGYLYAAGRDYPAVPERPTQAAARAALAALREPWVDFPFTRPEAADVPVALVLTLVARPAIRGACPGFVFDASTQGSGKTLLGTCATILAHGRAAGLVTWPGDGAELEKMIGALALRGAQVVHFDNIKTLYGGEALEKALTCEDRIEPRVLGESRMPALPWRAVVIGNGNNTRLGRDMTRRVLACRLEPETENPEQRSGFALPNIETWCAEQHPRMVAAALTLLRAHALAGRPKLATSEWGSFTAWDSIVGDAIRWAGGHDVSQCRPTVAGEDDDETSALRGIVAGLPAVIGDKPGITTSALVEKLYPAKSGDGHDGLRAAIDSLVQHRGIPQHDLVGVAFAKLRRKVVDGHFLERTTKSPRSWRVLPANKLRDH